MSPMSHKEYSLLTDYDCTDDEQTISGNKVPQSHFFWNEIKSIGDFVRMRERVARMIDDNLQDDQSLDLSNGKVQNMPITPILHAISQSGHSPEIKHLWLNNNNLFGTISKRWDLLPKHLQTLSIEGNQITGNIEWPWVPRSLKTMVVTGDMAAVSFLDAPARWKLLCVHHLLDKETGHGIWRHSEKPYFVFKFRDDHRFIDNDQYLNPRPLYLCSAFTDYWG